MCEQRIRAAPASAAAAQGLAAIPSPASQGLAVQPPSPASHLPASIKLAGVGGRKGCFSRFELISWKKKGGCWGRSFTCSGHFHSGVSRVAFFFALFFCRSQGIYSLHCWGHLLVGIYSFSFFFFKAASLLSLFLPFFKANLSSRQETESPPFPPLPSAPHIYCNT